MSQRSVSPRARLGADVTIGPFTVVHDDVEIGDGTTVGSHCVLGEPARGADGPLRIGPGSTIRSHSTLYAGSTLGPGLATGHGVLVREGARVGRACQIGTQSLLEGPLEIGDGTRLNSQVVVAPGTSIGRYAWIFAKVIIMNDPFPPSTAREPVQVGDLAVVGACSTLYAGAGVGRGAFVAANSALKIRVPDATCAGGAPARVLGPLAHLANPRLGLRPPWSAHYRSGYPPESGPELDALTRELEELMRRRPAREAR